MENLNLINDLTVWYAKCIAIKSELTHKQSLLKYVKDGNEEELIQLNGYYRDCISALNEVLKTTSYIIKNTNKIIEENLRGLVADAKAKTEFANEKLNDTYFINLSKKYDALADTSSINL